MRSKIRVKPNKKRQSMTNKYGLTDEQINKRKKIFALLAILLFGGGIGAFAYMNAQQSRYGSSLVPKIENANLPNIFDNECVKIVKRFVKVAELNTEYVQNTDNILILNQLLMPNLSKINDLNLELSSSDCEGKVNYSHVRMMEKAQDDYISAFKEKHPAYHEAFMQPNLTN